MHDSTSIDCVLVLQYRYRLHLSMFKANDAAQPPKVCGKGGARYRDTTNGSQTGPSLRARSSSLCWVTQIAARSRGACDNVQLGNLTQTLSNIMPAVYAVKDVCNDRTSKNKTFVQKVADENVRLTVQALTERGAVLKDLVVANRLKVVGAMYEVGTGRVSFLG